MSTKIALLIAGLAILTIIAIGSGMLIGGAYQIISIDSFEKCTAAGYPILESYPEQCKTPDGRTFVRNVKPSPPQATFGNPTTLQRNETVVFDDGLKVELVSINDSRCKEGVVCVWAGELAYQFKADATDIALGTVNNRQIAKNDYLFELVSGTETQAIINVTKTPIN